MQLKEKIYDLTGLIVSVPYSVRIPTQHIHKKMELGKLNCVISKDRSWREVRVWILEQINKLNKQTKIKNTRS